MSDYDVTLTPTKVTAFDRGRKLKFWDDADGTIPAVVKNLDGATLTQPIKVPGNGHLSLRFDQWPVYYSDNRGWRDIKMVPGMPATVGAAVGDPIEQQANIAAIGADDDLTILEDTADLDETVAQGDIDDDGTIDGTELAAMLSADHARINAIRDLADDTATQVNAIRAKLDAVIAALVAGGVLADAD